MSNAKTLPICTFDFETDPFKQNRIPIPFAADIFTGSYHRTWWCSSCASDCFREILSRRPAIWYAHNGGKFDFHYLIPLIPRKLVKKFLTINGRIVQIVFENGTELRDSFALIPRALREWAKDDIDYTHLEENVRQTHCAEIIRYLKKDTEYLHEMVAAFVGEYGMHLTLASAAFKILHSEFGVKRSRISETMDAKFRSFYFAGRVEYYQLGCLSGDFVAVDINSSFPWSMTQKHWTGGEYLTLSEFPKAHFEQSFFKIECESHGAFAYREEDGSVSFPVDGLRRVFFTTGWEYRAAESLYLLAEVCLLAAFVPIEIRDYKKFIDHFYRIKLDGEISGDKGKRLFAKLLQNSGYGKFGMDPREHEELRICDWRIPPYGPNWEMSKDDPANGITIYKRDANAEHQNFNNVCVAASITGCSRALLLRALHSVDTPVYCDTDSIICRNPRNLVIGTNLGDWKTENEFDRLYIGGKKLYTGHDRRTGKWKCASKGVRLTPGQIINVCKGNEVTFTFDAPSFSLCGSGKLKKPIVRFTSRRIRRADKRHKNHAKI